jgi:hypothetical protein
VIRVMTVRAATTNHPCMAISHKASTARRIGSQSAVATGLVDDVLASYVEWRMGADLVASAYRQWADARAGERETRFCVYIAALDQEEAAAKTYARSFARLEGWLSPPRPPSTWSDSPH